MSKYTDVVKAAARRLEKSAAAQEARGNTEAFASFKEMASELGRAAEHMTHLEALTSALPPDLGNIHDLPHELLDELSVAKTDEIEDQIVTVINAYGNEASLDQILVGLYRKFGVVQKRRFLQNKLYRMSMVWSVPGRKGIYTTTEPVEGNDIDADDLDDLLGPETRVEEPDDSEIPF